MEVRYRTKDLENVCKDVRIARKRYGMEMATKIMLRIDQIRAADTVDFMVQSRIGRCHSLEGKRKNQFAVDLVQPWRMVFTVQNERQIEIAEIQEIVDYH